MSATQQVAQKTNKHPPGLWCLSATYALYTVTFGMITNLLVLYITRSLHLSDAIAYSLYAGFTAIIWTFPVLGGHLASRYGFKYVTIVGISLCVLGSALLSVRSLPTLYAGLGLFVVGYGLSTPACFSLVGFLYDKQDPRREGAYTLFYLLFNFGFLVSGILGGFISQRFGYHTAFVIATWAMLASLLTFLLSLRIIKAHPGRSINPITSYKLSWFPLLAVIVIGGLICTLLLRYTQFNDLILGVLTFGSIITMLYLAFRQKNHIARSKLLAYIILCIVALGFWSLYMLEPSLLTIFIAQNVNRTVFGLMIPAATYYSLDAFFVIVMGFFFSWLWRRLSRANKNPSLPTKFSLALILVGLGYVVFRIGIHFANPTTHLTHSFWVVFGYFFLTVGELLLVPIGMSMVGRLSPKGMEGFLMGIWTLFAGYGAIVSGYIANFTVIPKGETLVQSNFIYSRTFLEVGLITVAMGILTFAIMPWLKKLTQV